VLIESYADFLSIDHLTDIVAEIVALHGIPIINHQWVKKEEAIITRIREHMTFVQLLKHLYYDDILRVYFKLAKMSLQSLFEILDGYFF